MEEPVVTTPTETPQLNGGTPPPEPAKPAVEPQKEIVSDKFAALARKEKAIVKARQEISAMKAEMEKERASMSDKMAEFERWGKIKANAKLDPDAYLKEADLSYGFLTEKALKGEKADVGEVLAQARSEINALRKELADKETKTAEAQKTQAQQDWDERVSNFKTGIHSYIDQNKDAFELINLHGQQDLVFELIAEAGRRKQDMTVKEASEKIENYLAEQVEKAITTSKRFKEKYTAKEEPKAAPVPGSPTLNNSMNTTTPVNPGVLTDRERTERALAALNKALGE